MRAALAVLAAVSAVAACHRIGAVSAPAPPVAAAVAVPPAPRPLVIPEEILEFQASFRGIPIGVVQTAVGRPGWVGGRHAIIVRSRGKSEGLASLFGELVWELSTTIDLDDGLPIEDREEAWLSVAGHDEHHTWSAGERRHDVHSVISLLRGWQSRRGDRADAQVGLAGARLPLVVWNAGGELLASAGKPAIRYDGRVRDRVPFTIWISDDTARVPLAFQADTPLGAVKVELVDYSTLRAE